MKPETKAYTFASNSKYWTLSVRLSVQRLSKLVLFKNVKTFLIFLEFKGSRQSAQQRCHAQIERRWGDHVLPSHARCPE